MREYATGVEAPHVPPDAPVDDTEACNSKPVFETVNDPDVRRDETKGSDRLSEHQLFPLPYEGAEIAADWPSFRETICGGILAMVCVSKG